MIKIFVPVIASIVTAAAFFSGPAIELPSIASNFTVNDYLVAGTRAPLYSPTADTDEGALRFECNVSHLAWDDPIVYPGVLGGSPHLHHFFGNSLTDYSSTYSSLRSVGNGTCAGGPINRTGYWFPAMIRPQNNVVVEPDFITIYYKVPRNDTQKRVFANNTQNPTRKLPRGLRYVMGMNLETGIVDPVGTDFFWGCEADSPAIEYANLPALAAATNCTGLVAPDSHQARIFVRLSFGPNCWDGRRLDSPNHRSHVANKVNDGSNMCPATHPVPLAQVTMIVWWSHNGAADFGQWNLSCDFIVGHLQFTAGGCFHTDWFGAWDETISDIWQLECDGIGGGYIPAVDNTRNGVGGEICNAGALNQLTNANVSIDPIPAPTRYLAIPARP